MTQWFSARQWMILACMGCLAVSRALGGYEYGWAFLVVVALIVMGRDLWNVRRRRAGL
jgi:hypothetical protein